MAKKDLDAAMGYKVKRAWIHRCKSVRPHDWGFLSPFFHPRCYLKAGHEGSHYTWDSNGGLAGWAGDHEPIRS